MTRATSDQAVQVWEVISRAHCSMTAALEKDLLPQTGLQLGWYQVLSHLSQAPGSMLRFQDLARVAGITVRCCVAPTENVSVRGGLPARPAPAA
jgi:hypothetical protein